MSARRSYASMHAPLNRAACSLHAHSAIPLSGPDTCVSAALHQIAVCNSNGTAVKASPLTESVDLSATRQPLRAHT